MSEWFPIMGQAIASGKWWVPWAMLAPHEAQAQLNHSQSLETLASRGGLDPAEALAVVTDRRWQDVRNLSYTEAAMELQKLVVAFVLALPR